MFFCRKKKNYQSKFIAHLDLDADIDVREKDIRYQKYKTRNKTRIDRWGSNVDLSFNHYLK
jgi:hypothetical protein